MNNYRMTVLVPRYEAIAANSMQEAEQMARQFTEGLQHTHKAGPPPVLHTVELIERPTLVSEAPPSAA